MNENLSKYRQVENKIKDDIKSGLIKDKLPGERVLAEQLAVSYMTVRKAVQRLVDSGILYKVPTKGIFLNSSPVVGQETHNIGFFLDDRIKDGVSSPYYSLVFSALEKEAIKNGYNLVFFSNFDDLNPLMNKRKVDGMVISCFPRLENGIQELKSLIPIVLMDNNSADKTIPSVVIDNFNGIAGAVDYLCSLGHERIGFISGLLDSDVGKDRLKGFVTAINNRGLKEDKELVYKGDYSYLAGEKGVAYFLALPVPPTAILCANDTMAISALKAIRENGLSVPEDISVVGFDDISVAAQMHPELTTVAAPIKQIAGISMEMLISAIKGADLSYKHVILPTRLVVRNSCAGVKK